MRVKQNTASFKVKAPSVSTKPQCFGMNRARQQTKPETFGWLTRTYAQAGA